MSRNTSVSLSSITANLVVKRLMRNYGNPAEKFVSSLFSRSLKVSGTDTHRSATYDFLSVFHSNYGPISYRFRHKGRYLYRKNFPPSKCLTLPVREFCLKFSKGGGTQRTTMMPLPDRRKSVTIGAFV